MRNKIFSLGEAMVEFNQTNPESPLFLQGFGGDTSNALIAAARQGAQCAYISKVGDDLFGQWLLKLWRTEGIDTQWVQTDTSIYASPTAAYFVTHERDEGHSFHFLRKYSAASMMQTLDFEWDMLQDARFLHISGISQAISSSARATVRHAMVAAQHYGVGISYDSNFRPKLWSADEARMEMQATLPYTQLFLPSLDDMQAITGIQDPKGIVDWIIDISGAQGTQWIALKMGAQGVWLIDRTQNPSGNNPIVITPHKVQSVDATGAGDCFAGALLARLSLGDPFPDAARYANAAAAISTMGYGAVAPIPQPKDVYPLLAA